MRTFTSLHQSIIFILFRDFALTQFYLAPLLQDNPWWFASTWK